MKVAACIVIISLISVNMSVLAVYSQDNLQISQENQWTFLLYFNGDNKLSSALQQTVNQLGTLTCGNGFNIAILYDGRTDVDTKLYYIQGSGLEEQEWPEESDMATPENLVSFIKKVQTDLPAEQYGLTLVSNKGSGWQGICWDDHGDGTMITMPELSSALAEVTNDGQNPLDILLVETCLGGNLAVRYECMNYCEYFIGYADCGLIGDIPYQQTFTDLIASPDMNAEEVSTAFVNYFEPQDLPSYGIVQSFSATKSSMLTSVISSIDAMASYLIENEETYHTMILDALLESRKYGVGFNIDYYIDLVHFLDLLNIDDPSYLSLVDTIQDAIDTCVISLSSIPGDHTCGFNIYFPNKAADYNHAMRYESGILPSPYEETQFAQDTQWNELIALFLGIQDNTAPSTPTFNGPTQAKTGEEQTFTISAVDPEANDISYYIDWGDGTNSGWLNPSASNEEITLTHIWETKGTYHIQAKARDTVGAESEWASYDITLPKTKDYSMNYQLLFGIISDIEYDNDGGFRFLPEQLIQITMGYELGFSFHILNESYGGFPCCCYISINEFSGFITPSFICGIWSA